MKAKINTELNEINNLMAGYNQEAAINPDIEPEVKQEKVETRGRKKKQRFDNGQPVDNIDRNKTVTGGELISGAIILLFIDLLIPNVLAFSYNKINKKKKRIDAKILQLTDKQKNELEPLANEAAKQMLLHASPMTVFVTALLGIYGLNFFMITNTGE
jgi:hypothetical protein